VKEDGTLEKTEIKVTFAGNFNNAIKKGEEGSITLSLNSATETTGNITVRASNSFCVGTTGNYSMNPVQINTIMDLTVNGEEVSVPSSVVLRGCGPDESYVPLFGVYYEFTFENVSLDAGLNIVKFNFKKSTKGDTNARGETLATLNVDYVDFTSEGSEIPENYEIETIEISDQFTLTYSDKKSEISVPVVATLKGGTKMNLDESEYEIVSISGGDDPSSEYIVGGEYVVIVRVKDNPSITASKTFNVTVEPDFVFLTADVVVEGDKVYYVFTGTCVDYTADDIKFFDGNTYYDFTMTFPTLTTFELKIDVTDISSGTTIYPHAMIDDAKYENGANSNGDIRGRGLTWTNGKSVTLGGKTYTLKNQWSMPTLVVTDVAA